MLKWRAITSAIRATFPDVIGGLYTPEELDPDNTIVYDDGSMVIQQTPSSISQPITDDLRDNQTQNEPVAPNSKDKSDTPWYTDENVLKVIQWAFDKNHIETRERKVAEKALFQLASVVGWNAFNSGREACEIIQARYDERKIVQMLSNLPDTDDPQRS